MNRLAAEQRTRVVAALVEGNSIRATCRMTGAAKNTVVKLLVDLGAVCSEYMDRTMRDLACQRVQCDGVWAACHSKQQNVSPEHDGIFGYGDVWAWTAIDAETKLMPCWMVGRRDTASAIDFISDLAGRLANRVQLTTDGYRPYVVAVEDVFGADID
jgi:hypothetical protein